MPWLIILTLTRRPQWLYRIYLDSATWKRRRAKVLKRDGHRCQKCRTQKDLHVHHKSYFFVGLEPLFTLATLCAHCHRRVHRRGRLWPAIWSCIDDLMAFFCAGLLSILIFAIIFG